MQNTADEVVRPETEISRDRILAKAYSISRQLRTAVDALDGRGGSVEEMSASVRASHQLMNGFVDWIRSYE